MDLFRLTYFFCCVDETDKWRTDHRYEIYGSAEAICNIYLTFKNLEEVAISNSQIGGIPRFIEIYSKDGQILTEQFKKHGLNGLYGNVCNTFK